MPAVVRKTSLVVLLDGQEIPNVLSCRWSFGYDQRVSECTVICAQVPIDGGTRTPTGYVSGGTPKSANYYSSIDIIAGAGFNNVLRFSGLLLQYDYSLWPRAVSLMCKGRLQLVADFENTDGWIDLAEGSPTFGEIVGGLDMTNAGAGQTDQDMVTQILNTVGTTINNDPIGGGGIGLDFGSGFIDGTGQNLGTLAYDISQDAGITTPFLWKLGQGGLAFIEELDRVSLGFRLYESSGSVLWRAQVFGRPNNDSVWTFTEGVDILEARATRTVVPTRNRVRVSGYDPGFGSGPLNFTQSVDLPNVQPINQWHSMEVSSPMIERAKDGDLLFGSTQNGISCEAVWNWQIQEVARELVKVSLTTPLDVVINPGDTISLLAPSRLGTTEPLWVMTVEGTIDERGSFSQTLTCAGGGLPNTGGTPPWNVG